MRLPDLTNADVVPDDPLTPKEARRRRLIRNILLTATTLILLVAVIGFFIARQWLRQSMYDGLPQLDGSIAIPGLSAPVTIQRDAHGVPHIRAASLDDLLFAQGFVTTQDRLWQMDSLRRHASGTLAEILGPSLLAHDRLERTLQLRAAADRAILTLPPDQLQALERYTAGVNASIALQQAHLPLEFRLLHYQPAPWTPRDSLLIGLVMFQDLTNSFSTELNREALTARLPQHLVGDLYPEVTWRDHPPAQAIVDLTAPQQKIPDVPLDESQTKLEFPHNPNPGTLSPSLSNPKTSDSRGKSVILSEAAHSLTVSCAVEEPVLSLSKEPAFCSHPHNTQIQKTTASLTDLLTLQQTLRNPICENCFAGSGNWVVSGAHTSDHQPLLSNDMHLTHNVPGIWYEADLQSPTPTGKLHVTGVSLPGVPFIIVGHNEHVAWGFTNLGAEVQDVYIEHTRGSGTTAEYESPDGAWHLILHQPEIIHVKGGKDVVLDVAATQHGTAITPILSPILPTEKRTLSLRWIIYDPANINSPFFAINTANTGAALVQAFSTFGGPAQNLVYADDQGHIGYHAVGVIPIRGNVTNPTPISPTPTDALDTTQQWTGIIPYDKLPQVTDPANGILATANSRITPDDYPYPITRNWAAPYRNQRIWKLLAEKSKSSKDHLTPADMLAIQTDVYSDVDHVIAQRLAYAIDHATRPELLKDKRLHQAADLLRDWNGNADAEAAAPAIVVATRAALWPLLLHPQVSPQPNPQAQTESGKTEPVPAAALYSWGNKAYAEEWLIMHTPSRWLPKNYATWDDLLTTAVLESLRITHAPADLSTWRFGNFHPIDIEHPVYGQSPLLQRIIGLPTGTGVQPQSGDDTTIKQVGRTFGPSERFTADLANLDASTLNLVLGESANPASPWFMDQWPAWYHGATFILPFTKAAVDAATTHTLTLTPR
jgi:penicillin G amidase